MYKSRFFSVSGLLVLSVVLCSTSAVLADDVVRVEEDWELVLDDPSDAKNSPQFETLMTPFGHADSFYGRSTWNYHELPDFVPGGLQMQAWIGDDFLFKKSFGSAKLSTVGETITWTQRLTTNGATLSLRIVNGISTTWGAFGGYHMEISGIAGLSNLNSYNTSVSVDNSAITYGANRVILLRIKQVRRYGANGAVLSVDNTSRTIHAR